MSVQVFCPNCDRSCRIKEELLGRRVRCPGCQEAFRAEEVPLAEAEPELEELPEFMPEVTPKGSRDDARPKRSREDDERSHKRSREDDERPHKRPRDGDERSHKRSRDDDAHAAKRSRDDDAHAAKRLRDDDAHVAKRSRDDDVSSPTRRTETKKAETTRAETKKDIPLVKPGDVANPFDSATHLASSAPVDTSLFDFDNEDVPATKPIVDDDRKKKDAVEHGDERARSRSAEEDRERERKKARRDADDEEDREKERQRAKKHAADTELAREQKKASPDRPSSKAEIALGPEGKGKRPARDVVAPKPETPFSFGDEDKKPAAGAKAQRSTRHDDDDEEKKPAAKPKREPEKPRAIQNNDADFLGLQNFDDDAPAPDEQPRPKSGSKPGVRQYFHVRQSGFWSEAHLFRVFIEESELIFVAAASGKKDVAAMEEAVAAKSLDACDRKIRNKVLDLEELPIDELVEADRNSFRSAAGKITKAAIDAPRKRPVTLRIEHKTKGQMQFEFPSDDDVDRALDFLPDILQGDLEVNVRWDKAVKCFVAR